MQIKFTSHPANYIDKSICKNGLGYAITKEDSNGVKRRYLCGVASGMAIDAHGDRMTKECIADFIEQTKTKDIPLYVNHGKDFTRDIGLLANSEVDSKGDWINEYRLYDESDNVPQENKEEANHVWNQANGIAPYSKPKQFGFSIEGIIPDGQFKKGITGKEIYKVDLDPGVSLVTKPAYTTSIATAIAKAFRKEEDKAPDDRDWKDEEKNGLPIEQITNVTRSILDEKISAKEKRNNFYDSKYDIESALNSAVEEILVSPIDGSEKTNLLSQVYDSFKEKMLSLYSSVNFNLDAEPTGSVSLNADMLTIAKEAIGKLNKNLTEVKNMDENFKTVLSEVVASLQMLLDAGQETPEITEALKSISKKLKKEEPKETPKEEDNETKELLKTLLKALNVKKEDAEIAPAPKEVEETKEVIKSLNSKIDTIEKGFEALLTGFLPEPKPVAKGLNENLGQDSQLEKLAELIAKSVKKSEPEYSNGDSEIRKNRDVIANYFRGK